MRESLILTNQRDALQLVCYADVGTTETGNVTLTVPAKETKEETKTTHAISSSLFRVRFDASSIHLESTIQISRVSALGEFPTLVSPLALAVAAAPTHPSVGIPPLFIVDRIEVVVDHHEGGVDEVVAYQIAGQRVRILACDAAPDGAYKHAGPHRGCSGGDDDGRRRCVLQQGHLPRLDCERHTWPARQRPSRCAQVSRHMPLTG